MKSTPEIVGPVQFEAERRGLRLEHTSDSYRRKLGGGYCRRCTDTVRFLDWRVRNDRKLQNVETELTTVLKEEPQMIESNSRQSKQADMSQGLALWLSGFETRIEEEVQKASKEYRHPCVKYLSRVAVNTQLVNSESDLPC